MSRGSVEDEVPSPLAAASRRTFLALLVPASLLAAYGTLAVFAGRFLFPAGRKEPRWTFVTDLGSLGPGQSRAFRTPGGATVAVARRGSGQSLADFVALSSTCPHLGCQVHWEAQNNRFFCPCHNGAFDPDGKAIAGPPAEAGQSLLAFPLKVERGMLFIALPDEEPSGSGRGA